MEIVVPTFRVKRDGGKARFVLTRAELISSARDSGYHGEVQIEGSGTIFLGSKNLAVGGNNEDLAIFSGVIRDGGSSEGAGGSLTKEGTGTLILNGVNTYTGATLVKGGLLVLSDKGSIANSSGAVIDNPGALVFNGTGDVGKLAIANHGQLVFENSSHADNAFITSDGAIFLLSAPAVERPASRSNRAARSISPARFRYRSRLN